MTDENYTFTQARTRLEEIVTQVRSKDVSLEKSLDLLEEGVRLANICTEQSDHTEWRSVAGDESTEGDVSSEATGDADVAEGNEAAQDSGDVQDGAQGESSVEDVPDETEPSGDEAADDSDDDSAAEDGEDAAQDEA